MEIPAKRSELNSPFTALMRRSKTKGIPPKAKAKYKGKYCANSEKEKR